MLSDDHRRWTDNCSPQILQWRCFVSPGFHQNQSPEQRTFVILFWWVNDISCCEDTCGYCCAVCTEKVKGPTTVQIHRRQNYRNCFQYQFYQNWRIFPYRLVTARVCTVCYCLICSYSVKGDTDNILGPPSFPFHCIQVTTPLLEAHVLSSGCQFVNVR